jgi:hypothetical protein
MYTKEQVYEIVFKITSDLSCCANCKNRKPNKGKIKKIGDVTYSICSATNKVISDDSIKCSQWEFNKK